MIRENRSLRTHLLVMCGSTLILCMIAFMLYAAWVINDRIVADAKQLLDRSITVAWQEYDRFFYEEQQTLQARADTDELQRALAEKDAASRLFSPLAGEDFVFAVTAEGRVLACNPGVTSAVPPCLLKGVAPAWRAGEAVAFSESVMLEEHAGFFPAVLADKAALRFQGGQALEKTPVLMQVSAVPVYDADGRLLGCIAGGKLRNQDEQLITRYSTLVEGSYIALGVGGIRVLSSITDDVTNASYIGREQPRQIYTATGQGQRYIGQTEPEPGVRHWIISDPIYNRQGQVVGSLSIGILVEHVAGLTRSALTALVAALVVCVALSIGFASLLAIKISSPVVKLERLAAELSRAESVSDEHIRRLPRGEEIHIAEIEQLSESFSAMTHALLRRQEESKAFLEQLAGSKAALQEANSLLEQRVQERTLQLQQANTELKISNSMKTQFLANVSHEFRTPLNSIIGFSEMLDDELFGALNQTQKDYIRIIHQSGSDLLEMINDVLLLSSFEQNRLSINKQPTRPEEIIAAAVGGVLSQARNKSIAIEKQLADTPPVMADPVRIRQVLNNLLTNAIKFTDEGGRIVVSTDCRGEMVAFSVSDNGIGISEEDQKRVFDEFFQCGDIYEKRAAGVGLGLPLAKQLVERHNGSIHVQSRLGVGTTFTFLLPCAAADLSAAQTTEKLTEQQEKQH